MVAAGWIPWRAVRERLMESSVVQVETDEGETANAGESRPQDLLDVGVEDGCSRALDRCVLLGGEERAE